MSEQAIENSAPIESTEAESSQASETNDNSNLEATESQASPAEQAKLAKLEAKPEAKLTKTEKKLLTSLKLKIDGKEFTEKLPFGIPEDAAEYMTKQLQMSKMGQKRAQEHAELQKQVNTFIEELRKNPRKILSDPNIGIDIKQLAASIIEEEIEKSKKSPEQLDKERLETRLREIEEERKNEKEVLQKREFDLLQTQAYDEYDKQITSAIESSNLPKSPYIVKKVADYMLMGLQEGMDITAADVLPLVEEEMKSDLKQMFAVLPEDVIEKLVGKDVLGRLRKKNVAKAKGSAPIPSKRVLDVGAKKSEPKPGNKQTFRQYFKV